ncbi:FemAB family XrtA/PEP-CTERM system-associated protein [Aromatoleum buckelii]|uniref:FemAB family PEP-CTERM system-associated protein n=1 Tax=Aromatoleum buckelii TaxID=200254 RepID=A0ABX1N2T1_9RHOO|nr:FemAB family XrtA/PEP-CTERM system-associated protein [Aromatoleum buckelii]MCK0510732.1 FemAB family PEP-CTERM system-associated protein [Aromatoleum buckelii]
MDRVPVVVRQLTGADHGRWDAFVRSCPDATFFHLSAWQGIIREIFRHRTFFLYAERAGDIIAVLPLAEVNSRLFGHALTSLPFCVYGGPAGDPEGIALVEAEAETLARRLRVQHLELRNLTPRHEEWPRQDLYVTFRKEIQADDDTNLLAIPRKQRAMVRKGIRHGLTSRVEPDVERFFSLYADNVLRHGTPALPKAFFTRLTKEFGPDCEVLTVSDADGNALSSVLSFYFRDEVLPYYAGDAVMARDVAANDFKYWELMRRAAARGCRLFDFGRSKIGTGPFSFKKNWGFEPQPLSYEYRLYRRDSVPQNNPMNPKYRAFIALWRRLPIRMANAIGPHIVRNLG